MRKNKIYLRSRFSGEVIQNSLAILIKSLLDSKATFSSLSIREGGTTWDFENDAEFFAEYRKPEITQAHFVKRFNQIEFDVLLIEGNTYVTIGTEKREVIESVFNIFEDNLAVSKLPEPKESRPVIFIGHGHNELWKELKDHLHEKHGYQVEAYEIGARAGHTIRDILESMMEKSSFSLLIMTGEDKGADGKMHPRDNVVHELGLFQGRLGFNHAIVLLEEGAEEFSNIHGIQQVRFKKENIKETFGEVLATLRREFGS